MSNRYSDRVLALAGLAQALHQVRRIAETGQSESSAVQASLESVFRIEAATPLAVYGRLGDVTPGLRVLRSYLAKEAQARQFLEAAAPEPADYPLIAGEVGVTADTAKAVAETILAMAKAWHAMGGAIEAVRLAAKKQVRQAPTPEAVQTVLAGIAWPEEPTA